MRSVSKFYSIGGSVRTKVSLKMSDFCLTTQDMRRDIFCLT